LPNVFAQRPLFFLSLHPAAARAPPARSSYILGGGPTTLPAFPVRAMCEHLADPALATGDPWALLSAFDAAGAVFNNVSGTAACYALPGGDIWLDGIWDVQYCTETLPEETYFTRDGVRDAFWPFAINRTATDAHCRAAWGVSPRWTAIARTYGGAHHGATRIAFSNGGFDPWSSGGVLPGSAADTPQTPAIFIPTGAHHMDLFFADPADPPEATAARAQEVALVKQWIAEAWRERRGG
jgi:lysosomal Pro-X carboxypeptidase